MTFPKKPTTLRLYWYYWMRHPWAFLGCLLFGPAFVLQTIISPLFVAKAVGQLASHHPVSPHYIVYSAVSLIGGLTLWFVIDKTAGIKALSTSMHDIYEDCFHHIIRQDAAFFADSFSGSLVTQANRFAKAHELFHITFFLDALGQLCAVLVALTIMLIYSPIIGLAIGALWLFALVVTTFLVFKRMPHRRYASSLESVQTGELADSITNAMTIKTFGAEAYEDQRYDQTNVKRAAAYIKSWHVAINNNFFIQSMCIVLQLTLFIIGVRAVEHHSISIATFLLFQVYTLIIINSITKSTLIIRQLEGIFGDSHEMTELFARQSAVADSASPQTLDLKEGRVNFETVRFGYQADGDKSLFKNLGLEIKPGERVGLVGPSGGGKTTITKLLLRFMDVHAGAITIDGQNIKDVLQAELHKAIGYVPQEPLLFHRSLFENISYGKQNASKAEVIAAAKRAHAHEFISALPDGYDTLVGERGVKLSGGQRQRVAIARAMLKNAPILVLDEATSALDSESEKYIQEALWELMRGKTSVVIAHRLSTIQHLDRIVVLDEGKIIEQGSHKDLLKKDGMYARLWRHQSGGFIEE